VQCLLRHPGVRIGLHYSGPLLEWLEQRHPEFFRYLQELTSREQIELVGGGFYEPILVSIPLGDQIRQIQLMRNYLREKFGREPEGAWLAERVWEPQVPSALASAGVGYTLVDDVHFLAAGFEQGQLFGDYVTEDRGLTVRVLPGQKTLRYLLPFRPSEETIGFLRDAAERYPGGMAAMGDDCEKFGAWPGTHGMAERRAARPIYPGPSAAGACRPAYSLILRNDGMDAAYQSTDSFSLHQSGVFESPGRAAVPAGRAMACLFHQISGIESAAQKNAADIRKVPQRCVKANQRTQELETAACGKTPVTRAV